MFTEWNGFGWLSLALAAIAVGLTVAAGRTQGQRIHILAMVTMVTGGAGLVLYNSTFSSVAVVVGLLLLCRRLEPEETAGQPR